MVDTLYQCKQECITHKLGGQNERKDKCRKGVAPQNKYNLYLCTCTDNDKVIVNERGEVVLH